MAFPLESTIQAMTGDMRGKLHAYMGSLEHRYGDPQVYALQREAAAMEHAERQFLASKGREQTQVTSYAEKRQAAREQHATRLETKSRPKYVKF
jgi:hypothetical protein